MENFSVMGKIKELGDEVSQHLRLRFGDVFFSYFIVFEIIFNWRFFYTLVGDGKPDQIESTIANAEKFISLPSFFIDTYEYFGRPSNLVLVLLASLLMTIVYPIVSAIIIFLRKVVVYHSNRKLSSGYPSNEDYQKILNDHQDLGQTLESLKQERLRELADFTRFLWPESPTNKSTDHRYVFCTPKGSSVFESDEICEMDSSNNCLIQKLDLRNIQRDRLGIVIEKINPRLYLCATGVNRDVPMTKTMTQSGQSYFGSQKSGKPIYFANPDEQMKQSLLLSVAINKSLGEISQVTFHM